MKKDRVGEVHLTHDGEHTMKIIEYYNAGNCTVRFDDGAIREHVVYANVISGRVAHPKNRRTKTIMGYVTKYQTVKRLGKTNIMSNGLRAEIIGYRTSYDVDVLFEDGIMLSHRYYQEFNRGDLKTAYQWEKEKEEKKKKHKKEGYNEE